MSVKVIAQLNAFSAEKTEYEFEPQPVSEIIKKIDTNNASNTGWRALFNDEIITDFSRVPADGTTVLLKLVPTGDNQDTGVGMKIGGAALAVIGVIVAAVGSWTGVGLGIGAALIGSGVGMLAGGIALYNIDIPSLKDRPSPEQDASIRGSQNQLRQRGYIPVLFGKRRFYADLAMTSYTWVDPSTGSMYLYQLFCAGQKDITIDESTLKIDETLLSSYISGNNIEYEIAYGEDVPPMFEKCIHEDQVMAILKHFTEEETDASVIKTTPVCTAINVDIFFHNGLAAYDDDGDLGNATVEVCAYYKKADEPDSAYQLLGNFTESGNSITGHELKTKRYAITKTGLESASYTVKLTRETADSTSSRVIDDVYVGSIRAIKDELPVSARRCRQLTLLALKIKATEKLNNVVQKLNFVSQSKMPVWDGVHSGPSGWTSSVLTSNPASAAVYAMQSEIAQQRLSSTEIDWPSFERLYTWCNTHEYECNTYVSESMSISQLLTAIGSTCRTEILRMNGKITALMDVERSSSVQLFTPRNSYDYSETIISADIPDALNIGFEDKDSGYAANELYVYNTPSGNKSEEPHTIQDVPLWGVTSSEQARKLGMWKYAVTKNRPFIHSWSCDVEYLMCQKGDRVKYAGDIALIGTTQCRVTECIIQNRVCVGIKVDEMIQMQEGVNVVRYRKSNGDLKLQTVVYSAEPTKALYFETAPSATEAPEPDNLVAVGLQDYDTIDLIITDIRCDNNLSAEITAVDYSPEVFGVDSPDFVLPTFVNKISAVPGTVDSGEFVRKELEDLAQKTIPDFEELYGVKKDAAEYTDSKVASATFEASPTYKAIFNTSVIKKDNTGSYTPSVITAHGYENIGLTQQNPFSGKWHIYINDFQPEYDVISGSSMQLNIQDIIDSGINAIDTIRIDFRTNDNALLIHQELIPILTGASAYSVKLSTPSIVLEGEKEEGAENAYVTETIVKTKAEVYYGLKELPYLGSDGWEYGIIDTPEGMNLSVDVESGELTIKILEGASLADLGNLQIPIFIHSQTSTQVAIGYTSETRATKMIVIGYDNIAVGYIKPDENGYYNTYFTWQKLSQNAVKLASLTQTVNQYWGILTDDLALTVPEKNTLERLFGSLTSDFEEYTAQFSNYSAYANLASKYNILESAVRPLLAAPGNYNFGSKAAKDAFNQKFEDYYTAKAELDTEISKRDTNHIGIDTTQKISGITPKVGDYFVWGGTNQTIYDATTLLTGMVYCWNGSDWVEDNSSEHTMATMTEALGIVSEVTESNEIPAVVLAKRLVAMKVITDELFANFASIQKLAAGEVIIGGYQKESGGAVQPFLTEQDVDDTISGKGYQTEDDVSDSVERGVKTVTDNIYTPGTTTIAGGKITAGSVEVDKLKVDEAFMRAIATRKLNLENGGIIKSDNWDGEYEVIEAGTAEGLVNPSSVNIGDYFMNKGVLNFVSRKEPFYSVAKNNTNPPQYYRIDPAGKYVSITKTVQPDGKLYILAHWTPPSSAPYDREYYLDIGDVCLLYQENLYVLLMWDGTELVDTGINDMTGTGANYNPKSVSVIIAEDTISRITKHGTKGFAECSNGDFELNNMYAGGGVFTGMISQGTTFYIATRIIMRKVADNYVFEFSNKNYKYGARVNSGRFLIELPELDKVKGVPRVISHYCSDLFEQNSGSPTLSDFMNNNFHPYNSNPRYQCNCATSPTNILEVSPDGEVTSYMPLYFTDNNNDEFVDPICFIGTLIYI